MRVTTRRLAAAATLIAALGAATACTTATTPSSALTPAPGATTSAPAPSTPPPSTAPASSPPAVPATTAAPVLTTMQAAAEHLYNAWKAGDKPTALQGASKGAVDTLFAQKWKDGTYFFGGCSDTGCQYNYAAGAVLMTISGSASSGFTVSAVSFGNAG